MDHDKRHNGWLTFLEYFRFPFAIILMFLGAQIPIFFIPSHATMWIWAFASSFTLMILGSILICYAKFPVYRSGRFLTFGIKSVPPHQSGYYRWGWGIFLFGVVLALFLLLSKP
jgi:hypothetical protein